MGVYDKSAELNVIYDKSAELNVIYDKSTELNVIYDKSSMSCHCSFMRCCFYLLSDW